MQTTTLAGGPELQARVWGSDRRPLRTLVSRIAETWSYRDLLVSLAAREVRLRYRGSVLGAAWSLFNPLLMTLIFTLLFTVFMQSSTLSAFPLFALIGILAWQFHANSITSGIRSLTDNAPLLAKTYFPREILPLSVVLANAVNFVLALPVLFAFIFVVGVGIGWGLLLLPLALLIHIAFLAGFVFLLSTLNVFYRDTGIIMDSLLLAWFFLTPVFYRPQDLFPEWQRLLYIVNPAASVIAIYRDILYSAAWPDPAFLVRTAAQAALVLLVGWAVFQHFADRFVEEL